MIVLSLAALVGAAAPARADVIPQFVGVPGNYVPNTPFTFQLRAPGLTAFTDFSFALVLETVLPDPLAQLTVSVTRPTDLSYPFGPAGTFSAATNGGFGGSQYGITVAGASAGPAVTTIAGGNDLLALVTVTPGPNMTDPIIFSIDSGSLSVTADSESGLPIQAPDPVSVFPQTTPNNPVPAPGGAVLLGVGGLALLARRRLARR